VRFKRRYRSKYVQDRRAASPAGGGLSRLPIGGLAGGGIGGVIILLLVLFMSGGLFGGDEGAPGGPGDSAIPRGADPEADLVSFVSFVFDDAQATWSEEFQALGESYRPARMVLYREATDSGCGFATSDVGPFYCPADETVYLDLGFFEELRQRYGAEGDFAQAYVIAHEVAHHVQTLLGISDRVQRLSGGDPAEANELSIQQELQADCLAGVWGQSTRERGLLESGDVQEGLGAAAAVGDDRIQKEATGEIDPDTWTHGSSEQRQNWFQNGLSSGSFEACDTFGWS
jgi:uncharacterized protein